MANDMLSDRIEKVILEMLGKGHSDEVTLRRKDVAEHLQCAPSQVTYVINTRFLNDDKFIVESRRGTGGYIRIALRSVPPAAGETAKENQPKKETKGNENQDYGYIERSLDGYFRMLNEYDVISDVEYRLIKSMMQTMLEFCPADRRREAAKAMISRSEKTLRGE